MVLSSFNFQLSTLTSSILIFNCSFTVQPLYTLLYSSLLSEAFQAEPLYLSLPSEAFESENIFHLQLHIFAMTGIDHGRTTAYGGSIKIIGATQLSCNGKTRLFLMAILYE